MVYRLRRETAVATLADEAYRYYDVGGVFVGSVCRHGSKWIVIHANGGTQDMENYPNRKRAERALEKSHAEGKAGTVSAKRKGGVGR